MKVQTLDLWTKEEYLHNQGIPTLTTYITDTTNKKPAIIICPGGGYNHLSDREAEPVALQFVAKGYQAFVVRYSVAPIHHPQPLLDVAKGIQLVRGHAEEWKVDSNKIIVLGFSAGGHVAASISVYWNHPIIKEKLHVDPTYIQPNGTILCYPVISFQEFAHEGSVYNLLGENPKETLKEKMSLYKQVGAHVPPTFIWHTVTDASVPVENSLFYITALQRHHIPFEAHLYDQGAHGLALAKRETCDGREELIDPHIASWLQIAHEWIERNI